MVAWRGLALRPTAPAAQAAVPLRHRSPVIARWRAEVLRMAASARVARNPPAILARAPVRATAAVARWARRAMALCACPCSRCSASASSFVAALAAREPHEPERSVICRSYSISALRTGCREARVCLIPACADGRYEQLVARFTSQVGSSTARTAESNYPCVPTTRVSPRS